MSEHPVADGPEAPGPRRNPMPWLLVTVLVVLAGVLGYAAVMVVRMLG